ncbi:MAG: DNA-binding response regulator [Vicingaceae bacterium]|jgi:DNA-binding response OmpR family regulator|nr:MAG: DNA-binding response regulator [Vicingaceae bacterium]
MKKENTKATILLVEDDTNLGFVISDNLKKHGYDVKLAIDGIDGLNRFNESRPDLCILDVMLPKKDGYSLAKDIRKISPDVPIIFLTAKSQTQDKLEGFNAGADDYITKPFDFDELLLRIEAILKRTLDKNGLTKKDIFKIGDYTFDFKNQLLTYKDGTEQHLTKKEADLLRLLVININNVAERDLLLESVWGKNDYFTGRSMDVFISKIRKYLSKDPRVELINVHGVGFKLLVTE